MLRAACVAVVAVVLLAAAAWLAEPLILDLLVRAYGG